MAILNLVAACGGSVVPIVGGTAAGGSANDAGAAGALPEAGSGLTGDAGSGGSAGVDAASPGAEGAAAGAAGAAGAAAGAAGAEAGPGGPPANPHCEGISQTCGPNLDQDCCRASLIPGGKFYRNYDGATFPARNEPATLSPFRLDIYEITVGRFRNFVAAYARGMIAEGSGKNPNNADDTGWNSAWNAKLPASVAALNRELQCDDVQQTWTQGDDSMPMNCISWYVAQAFCIWDGGRLPTAAEWNFAASGGTEARPYPWGKPEPDSTLAVFSAASMAEAGSKSPAGDGKWGQADLAGNLEEWVQDAYSAQPPLPCNDCAALTPNADYTMLRGGSFSSQLAFLRSASSFSAPPEFGQPQAGARCARSAD